MTSVVDVPSELLCKPRALIGLVGLETVHNAVHKSIWEAFSNNRRSDRAPLQFKLFTGDHEYPKCKPKRTSYDWYVPKGLLKMTWMRKHLEEVPAVAAFFMDLDWDDAAWRERLLECATRVEILRNSLGVRGTKVCVVLIQKRAPLPPGEDMTAAERAQALCSACELPAKNLYVLPQSDHLFGYIIRLETAFHDLAMNYYHNEAKKVKSHKEFLNKTTHQLLFVRHQFKIGFFNELKQDTSLALKHYRQAYANLLELRMHDTHLLEIKTVAGFVNYKICRLSFQHNASEAISQFRKHTDFFKALVGPGDLAFEHEAWMSKQFEVLGDLFQDAIRLGLTALMTQHPGLYYQEAAQHAISRRRWCQKLCRRGIAQSTGTDPLESMGNLEFYGQRPWRQGHQSIDPPDPVKERDGVIALQALEGDVKHSTLIIPLLTHAVTQYNKYKAHRMKQYPLVLMGEEYFYSKEYNNALACFNRVTADFRKERWWSLLTSVLTTALKCAFLIGNITEYISVSLELIGADSQASITEKARIQNNLHTLFQNEVPSAESSIDDVESIDRAREVWREAINTYDPQTRELSNSVIDMSSVAACVECKAYFSNESFAADEPIKLTVFLRSSAPLTLTFTKISIEFSNKAYNNYGVFAGEDGEGITLDPLLVGRFEFIVPAEPEDVGRQIRVDSVSLEAGHSDNRCHVILQWQCASDFLEQVGPPPVPACRTPPHKAGFQWDLLAARPIAEVCPREANLSIEVHHTAPILVKEFYAMKLTIVNKETSPIREISLSVGLSEGQDSALEQSSHVILDEPHFDGKMVSQRKGIDLGTLESGQETHKNVYLTCLQPGDRRLVIEVSYMVSVALSNGSKTVDCCCRTEKVLWLPVVHPFESSVRVHSQRFLPINELLVGDPFVLQVCMTNSAPWELEVKTSELQLNPPVQSVGEKLESQVENVEIKSLESITECQMLVVQEAVSRLDDGLGVYTLHWRRKQTKGDANDTLPWVTTTLTLPSWPIESVPICVNMEMPSHAVLRSSLLLTYTLQNRTLYPQEVEAQMDLTEGFMYSGNRVVQLRVLPQSESLLTYNLHPLITGNVPLPKLQIRVARYQGAEDRLIRAVPTHVFVKPCGKENVNSVV